MVVSFSGLPIYSSSSDLCSKTACPVPAGPITITLVEALPPIAPPVSTSCTRSTERQTLWPPLRAGTGGWLPSALAC